MVKTMITIKKKMTEHEICDLIEASLPRFFGSFNKDQSQFVISRKRPNKWRTGECVVLTSTNGIFNAYWMKELVEHYVCLVIDGEIYLESIRNLYLVKSAL